MLTLADLCQYLESFAPRRLAEDWDNVGLLAGNRGREIQRVMTCLTITPDTAAEAVREQVDLVVSHHPLPFKPLRNLSTEQTPGALLWQLITSQVAIFSPHSAFDSARRGINQRLAEGLQLQNIQPLQPLAGDPDGLGAGRQGILPQPRTLAEVAAQLKQFLGITGLHRVGSDEQRIERVGIACGSAGSFLAHAHRAGCQLFITGETSFHSCLEAEALGVALLLPGHYASERFGVEALASEIQQQFPVVKVWASRVERDPLTWC
ncbi:MAG: Nif3-like dinuclear metal center hexameric protein [Planctomycetota bacterium]